MSYLDKYINNLINSDSSYLRQTRIDDSKFILSLTFKEAPNFYRANSISDDCDYDLQITESTDSRDEKTFIATFESTIHLGSLIFWQNSHWIVSHFDSSMGDMYLRGKIRKCISSLKWQNDDADILEAFFCYDSENSGGLGINEGKIISTQDTRRDIIIPNNSDTRKFALEERFIFDTRVWKIIKYDQIKNDGLIYLTLDVGQIDTVNDNMTLRIANYKVPPVYSLSLIGADHVSVNIVDTLQINAQLTKDGVIVPSPILSYLSSDKLICLVDRNGLILPLAEGNATITVTFKDLTQIINVTVTNVVSHNYSVEITDNATSNKFTIVKTVSKTFGCAFKDNGVAIVVDGVFSVTDVNGNATTLATITSQTTNTCVVKGGSTVGNVLLHVRSIDGTITTSKQITIRSAI
jgi:hypothetical protein